VLWLCLKVFPVRLQVHLHLRHFSPCHWTSDPVSSILTFPRTQTSGAVPTVQAHCFLFPSILWRGFRTSSMKMMFFADSWRKSEKWMDSPLSGRAGCQNRTKSRSFRGEIGLGRGAVGRSCNSFGRRIKIWSSVCESSRMTWWNWSRKEKVCSWRFSCCRMTSRCRKDGAKKPRVHTRLTPPAVDPRVFFVAPIFVSFKYTLKLPFWSKDRHRRHGHRLWLQLTVKCPRNAPSFSALISSDGLGFQNSKNFLWITGLPHSAEVYPNFFTCLLQKRLNPAAVHGVQAMTVARSAVWSENLCNHLWNVDLQ